MYSEQLNFREDGTFRIMQVADIQEEAEVSPDTLRLLKLAIEREKPDIAVLTGDQINAGISPSFFTGDKKEKLKKLINDILSPFEEAGIPYAVTFGNHDELIGIPNYEQADIYAGYPHCISVDYRNEKDRGTFRLPLFYRNRHVFDIYVFDSNGQLPTGEYKAVEEEKLTWFRKQREQAKEKDYTKGIVFQHIPVPEYYNVINKVNFGTRGAVEAFRTHKHEFYVLPEEIKKSGGFMYESPAVPDRNSGEFDVLNEKGNILAMFVGHDHINSFVSEYKGMKLIYTQCCGFNVYGPHLKRGVRIIDLNVNNLSEFSTHTVTYEELTDEKLNKPFKEFILTHIPTSMEQVKRLVFAGLSCGTAAGIAGAVILYKKLKK